MKIKNRIAEINKEMKQLKSEKKNYLLDNSKHVFNYFEKEANIK